MQDPKGIRKDKTIRSIHQMTQGIIFIDIYKNVITGNSITRFNQELNSKGEKSIKQRIWNSIIYLGNIHIGQKRRRRERKES
jgi:hypothetical protein